MSKIEVLKFYADWCGPCRTLSKVLEGKEGIQEINIDVEHEIAVRHNVRRIPTLVFLKDGVEKYRSTGLITVYEYNVIMEKLMTSNKPVEEIEVFGAQIVAHMKDAIDKPQTTEE